MTNKRFIPVVAAILLLLPGLYFGGFIPLESNRSSYSPPYSIEELKQYSHLTVEGILAGNQSYVEWYIDGNVALPTVFTIWTVQSTDNIKGTDSETVEFVVLGGTYNNIKQTLMHDTKLNNGDKVVIFLSDEKDTIYGDRYFLTGGESGIFQMKDDGKTVNIYQNKEYDSITFKSFLWE